MKFANSSFDFVKKYNYISQIWTKPSTASKKNTLNIGWRFLHLQKQSRTQLFARKLHGRKTEEEKKLKTEVASPVSFFLHVFPSWQSDPLPQGHAKILFLPWVSFPLLPLLLSPLLSCQIQWRGTSLSREASSSCQKRWRKEDIFPRRNIKRS